MNLKPINPNWTRKVTGKEHSNKPKQVIDLNQIKAELKSQILSEVKSLINIEISKLKNELLLSTKDNQINTLNQLNQSLLQTRDFSTENLLRELKNELSSFKSKEVEEKEVKTEPVEEVVEESVEESVEEENISVEEPIEKHFEIDGNPVLSYCADYVYKIETGKDNAEKKADKVYEFINFDAVKNSRIKAVDIYSVIGMPISSELKTKLVDNKLLTSEEIALYNANFNLNDEIEEE